MTDHDEEQFDLPSKSQRKRDAHALQNLGEQLTQLRRDELTQLSLPESLLAAILEMQKIRQHGARKRQLQFIGKLMRQVEPELIKSKLDKLKQAHLQNNNQFHQLEQWRDRLLNDEQSLADLIHQYPEIDVQHIRQLIRNARKEQQQSSPPRSARLLFKYLREVLNGD